MNRRKWLYAAATLAVAGILAVSRRPVDDPGKGTPVSPASAVSAASDAGADARRAYLRRENEIVFGLPLSLLSPPGAPGPTWENYFRIENGMTRVEVEAILGGPPDSDPPGLGVAAFVQMQPMPLPARPISYPHLVRWEVFPQDELWPQIEIAFDRSGRVCNKRAAEAFSRFTTNSYLRYTNPGRLDIFLRQSVQWMRSVCRVIQEMLYTSTTSRRNSDDR
jgi:hypothetical protein